MSIKIYTYANPYEIDTEDFWDEIKDCPQFCVSQTMVNGMYKVYPHWRDNGQLTTIRRLVNSLYSDWDDINTRVRQIMEVDHAINELEIDHDNAANIRKSLLFNTRTIAECIRLFKELEMNPAALTKENLNIDQKLVVDIYRAICNRNTSAFSFTQQSESTEVEAAVKTAIREGNTKVAASVLDTLDYGTIVIHGIHQFNPTMLCAIEDMSRYKNVILLFNYQEQYSAVYDTWLAIYSLFDIIIRTKSDNQFSPVPLFVDSYQSNLLADYMGKLANGEYSEYNEELASLEVVEFANLTEFANYSADLFEKAKKRAEGTDKPALTFMKEQLYSPSNKVNDILRAYFPDQFGERHFLDYPIGHFFIATTNMWDSENERAIVENLSDVKECLNVGIISESKHGLLLNTLNRIEAYIEKENTLKGIISRLKNLLKHVGFSRPERARIGYFNVEKDSLKELIRALEELNDIIESFFLDFGQGADNFRRFYARIQKFIVNRVSNKDDLDDEMKEVLQRLLARLEQSDLPETGTFNCLKQTMNFYLSQDDNAAKGAQWIVRGFEQIDGDLLRSATQDASQTCYHFCCLSDKDICADRNANLPWPLDIKFFEYANAPTLQKYRIFLKSKLEYHNFNRYALLYGLEFNRVGCKLSYIKTEDGKDNDLFHMLALLGIKVKSYKAYENGALAPKLQYQAEASVSLEEKVKKLNDVDCIKLRICPYRFVLESVVQERTEYREQFLIHTYLRVLIGNQIQIDLQGELHDESKLQDKILEVYQSMSDKFKLSDEIEKTKLVAAVHKDIGYTTKNHRYRMVSAEARMLMKQREDLLLVNIKNIPDPGSQDVELMIREGQFQCTHGGHCKYCASKDICLEHNFNED